MGPDYGSQVLATREFLHTAEAIGSMLMTPCALRLVAGEFGCAKFALEGWAADEKRFNFTLIAKTNLASTAVAEQHS